MPDQNLSATTPANTSRTTFKTKGYGLEFTTLHFSLNTPFPESFKLLGTPYPTSK
jgi:hypothetical protein